MSCAALVLGIALLGTAVPPGAHAQPFGQPDTVLTAPATRAVPGGRVDLTSGVVRAAYRLSGRAASPNALPAPEAARRFLAGQHAAFGFAPELDDLVLERSVATPHSRHVRFQQTVRGLPVYGRTVQVNLDAEGRPTLVTSGYVPEIAEAAATLRLQPALSQERAAAVVRERLAAAPLPDRAPQLVIAPAADDPPHLAWQLRAWTTAPTAEWDVLVDAHTGEVLTVVAQSTHAPDRLPIRRAAVPDAASLPPASTGARIDGVGFVYDPNPLMQAGVPYGGAYADAGDAANDLLNSLRREVPLRDITQSGDGLYRLDGPYIRITGELPTSSTYTPPARIAPDDFRFTRADAHFEAVNVYYHVDTSQRYVQSLDLGRPIRETAVMANPHGEGARDESYYLPSLDLLSFGDGGVDDAEDADLIWHEYAHALLEASAPNLLSTPEGRALHEGWADYWAASYGRYLVESGRAARTDWQTLLEWDSGDGTIWPGRALGRDGTYPDDTRCDDESGCLSRHWYTDGLLWATTLMEIYDVLGRTVTDRLNLASHAYLAAPVTFRDAAEALIQADRDLYDGAHASVLVQRLAARGYVDADVYLPTVAHAPLTDSEQVGGTRRVEVHVPSGAASVREARIVYGYGDAPLDQVLLLTPTVDNRYAGDLPLPPTPEATRYYVEVENALGFRVRLPEDAPQSTYRFVAGPDDQAPQIAHGAPFDLAAAGWPAPLVARVTDNLGIDTVEVAYTIRDAAGALLREGQLGLPHAEGLYVGSLPGEAPPVGSTVSYQLMARDIAAAKNQARLPADGSFTFRIVAEGALRRVDADAPHPPFQTEGQWAAGTPAYGLHVAQTGTDVWGTRLDGPYASAVQRSTLSLPPIDLSGTDAPTLVFWHWYDFEHDGTARPEGTAAEPLLWDGANVQVSTDGGATWAVATPEGGYPGTIASNFGNPLGGQPGYGGYSFGWRRDIVPLPAAPDVRVRFVAGSDASNMEPSVAYAGWYLDDLSVTTALPADGEPPVVGALPPSPLVADAEMPLPELAVTLATQDATGPVDIEDVWAEYDIAGMPGSGGQMRLAMDPRDRTAYRGRLAPEAALDAGDAVTYRIRLRDAAGNDAIWPPLEAPPLRIDLRLTERLDVLADVRPTGLWHPAGTAWQAAGADAGTAASSLVLTPRTLPANADLLMFHLDHVLRAGEGAGGNVKISVDDGASWTVLPPDGGYASVLAAPGHPMDGQPVFAPADSAHRTFDLRTYAGTSIRLRVDLATARPLPADGRWRIDRAALAYATPTPRTDGGFDVPHALALHANYPDPFATTTTVSYTLAEEGPVQLDVFDLLGRRVLRLVDGPQPAGSHTLQLDASTLASGLYLLRLTAGGTHRTERVVVAR